MKADIIADKLAAKKKLEARRARTKLLKEQSRKQQGQVPKRMTKAERLYMETHGINPSTLKKTDNRAVIEDKVKIKKTDASNTALKNKKIKEKLDNRKDAIQMLAAKQANKNKNIKKSKAGEYIPSKDLKDKKPTKSSKDDYKKYSSIAAAKAAGSLYYMKNGKKMAAVFAEDLKGLTGSPQEKLRKYLNARIGASKKANKGMLIITIGSAKKMKKKNKK